MTVMHAGLPARLLFAALLTASTAPAHAIVLSLTGPEEPVGVGETFVVEVLITGLGTEIVSAFDLDVTFDPVLLSAIGVTFGGALGGPDDSTSGFVLAADRIDFFELSFLADESLAALQETTVTIAMLTLLAVGAGEVVLAVDDATPPGVDVKGLAAARLLFETVGTATVTIEERVEVAEPSTLALGLLSLAAMLGFSRRRSKH